MRCGRVPPERHLLCIQPHRTKAELTTVGISQRSQSWILVTLSRGPLRKFCRSSRSSPSTTHRRVRKPHSSKFAEATAALRTQSLCSVRRKTVTSLNQYRSWPAPTFVLTGLEGPTRILQFPRVIASFASRGFQHGVLPMPSRSYLVPPPVTSWKSHENIQDHLRF